MKILAIDTSCDETAAAVCEGNKILANVVWSQAVAHAKFGGVMPALAKRLHQERIDWTVETSLRRAGVDEREIGMVAVTSGPGLAIALEVGISKAKEWANKLGVPVMEVNHIEGHILSPLANRDEEVSWPAWGLVVSGGHTELVRINEPGSYEIWAETIDDALGEALDKAARMIGLGYPGGAVLEKMAREGKPKSYDLPLPLARNQERRAFSYSGLKTALFRVVDRLTEGGKMGLSKEEVCNLAASFQDRAFSHLVKKISGVLLEMKGVEAEEKGQVKEIMLVGGGVVANQELRKRLRTMARGLNLTIQFPVNSKLCGDNAGMIGLAAGMRWRRAGAWGEVASITDKDIDRKPRWKVAEVKY